MDITAGKPSGGYCLTIRDQLVQTVLQWEKKFGFFPGQAGITAAVSEYDAAMMLGHNEAEYITSIKGRSSVGRGHDFVFEEQENSNKGK